MVYKKNLSKNLSFSIEMFIKLNSFIVLLLKIELKELSNSESLIKTTIKGINSKGLTKALLTELKYFIVIQH